MADRPAHWTPHSNLPNAEPNCPGCKAIAKEAFALSPNQRNAILRLGGQRDGTFGPMSRQTMQALERRGLVAYGFNGTGGWHLTDAGRERFHPLQKRHRDLLLQGADRG